MIPKKIHYCWFGRGEKTKIVKHCIRSWKKFCPDYEIIEWNEDNFDINANAYCRQAYDNKKYAFVSDVVRAKVLYEYGGVYLDTDVEILKSFNSLLSEKCVLGFEEGNYVATSFMAVESGHELFKEFCEFYDNSFFIKQDGTFNTSTNVEQITKMLLKRGLVRNNKEQYLSEEIHIFEKEYFSPYNYINCIYKITDNSFCVHHFYVSWMKKSVRIKKQLKKCIVKFVGEKFLIKLRKCWNNK